MDRNIWNEYYEGNEESIYPADETLKREIHNLVPGKAIDFGAGTGGDSIWLAESGWDVTAIDFAPVAVTRLNKIAKSRNLKIKAVVGDVTEFETSERFNLVYICYMHLPEKERREMFRTASKILGVGGTLIFIGLPETKDMAKEFKDMFVDVDEVRKCIENLTIDKAIRTKSFVHLPEGPSITGIVLVRAHK